VTIAHAVGVEDPLKPRPSASSHSVNLKEVGATLYGRVGVNLLVARDSHILDPDNAGEIRWSETVNELPASRRKVDALEAGRHLRPAIGQEATAVSGPASHDVVRRERGNGPGISSG
jgi:hypothetical protein